MPTIHGMRRRGYTPEGIREFARRIGISKSENVVDMAVLEGAIREDLEAKAPRVMAVVNPLKVVLTNYQDGVTARAAGFHPNHPEFGEREVPIAAKSGSSRTISAETPPAGWQRLTPGGEVRLRYSYVIKCDEVVKDAAGGCRTALFHRPRHPGQEPARAARSRASSTGFRPTCPGHRNSPLRPAVHDAEPDGHKDRDFLEFLNPDSLRVVQGWVEAGVPRPRRRRATSSSGWVISAPTASTTSPGRSWCSTAPWVEGHLGEGAGLMLTLHNTLTRQRKFSSPITDGPGAHVCLRHDRVRLLPSRPCARAGGVRHDRRAGCARPATT
jgi:hypothetical protein